MFNKPARVLVPNKSNIYKCNVVYCFLAAESFVVNFIEVH